MPKDVRDAQMRKTSDGRYAGATESGLLFVGNEGILKEIMVCKSND